MVGYVLCRDFCADSRCLCSLIGSISYHISYGVHQLWCLWRKSNTNLSFLMTWRELRKFFLVTKKRNAQWGYFPASQNQCIISHQGKICYIGKCLTFTNWLCWKKDVIRMTLQSNFGCTTCLNISAVQESPSHHISSSLPEVKLLQKKGKERGKTYNFAIWPYYNQ